MAERVAITYLTVAQSNPNPNPNLMVQCNLLLIRVQPTANPNRAFPVQPAANPSATYC